MTRPGYIVGWRRPGWRFWTALVGLLGVAAVVGLARLAESSDGPDEAGASTGTVPTSVLASPSAPTPTSTRGNDGVVGAPASPYAKPPHPAAIAVALAFTRAWVHHPAGMAPDQWWRAVARFTDQTLAGQLRAVDPNEIPATRVTGAPQGIFATPTSAEIAVPSDAGRVVVLCVHVNNRWVVATVDLEERPS